MPVDAMDVTGLVNIYNNISDAALKSEIQRIIRKRLKLERKRLNRKLEKYNAS